MLCNDITYIFTRVNYSTTNFFYTLSCRTYLPTEYSVYKFMYWSILKLDRLEKRASFS